MKQSTGSSWRFMLLDSGHARRLIVNNGKSKWLTRTLSIEHKRPESTATCNRFCPSQRCRRSLQKTLTASCQSKYYLPFMSFHDGVWKQNGFGKVRVWDELKMFKLCVCVWLSDENDSQLTCLTNQSLDFQDKWTKRWFCHVNKSKLFHFICWINFQLYAFSFKVLQL